jgi:hypothetical protein
MAEPMIAPQGMLQGDIWQEDSQRFSLYNSGASPACNITAFFLHGAQPGCFVLDSGETLAQYTSMPVVCSYTANLPRFPAKFPRLEKILAHMWYAQSLGRLTLFYDHPDGEKYGAIYEYTEHTWQHAATFSHVSWSLDTFF